MENAIKSTLGWLESNQSAEKDEIEYRKKEIENICSPIITKLYSSGSNTQGPTIEQVD